jgi:hypothetical protein
LVGPWDKLEEDPSPDSSPLQFKWAIPENYFSDLYKKLHLDEDPSSSMDTFVPPRNKNFVNDSDYKRRRLKSESNDLINRSFGWSVG